MEQNQILLIIIGRLGSEGVQENLYQGMLKFLSHRCSLGVIGGIPRKAYYFIGHEDQQLIYLDPHLSQEAVKRTNF